MSRVAACLLIAGMLPSSLLGLSVQQSEEQKKQQEEVLREGLPKKKLTDKQQKDRDKKIRQEMESHFKKWLEEDVGYIISPEEQTVFNDLSTEEEREQFIEQFWRRRDPTPDTLENEYKEEHYRRIAYVNERYSMGRPGWLSDRGRIYIIWGPADEVKSWSGGSQYHRLPSEGVGSAVVYPTERWRYRYLDGIGNEVIIEFIDKNGDADFRLVMEEEEKEVFLTPGTSRALLEQMGLSTPNDRNLRTGGEGLAYQDSRYRNLDRLIMYSKLHNSPPIKFKDLETIVNTRISFNLLPFDIRTDHIRITNSSILVPITVSLKKEDLFFKTKDGIHEAVVNVFGRITTLTGRIAQTFEDVIQVSIPPSLFETSVKHPAIYQKAVPLRPGLYKLSLVMKDLGNGKVGAIEERLTVPRFEEDQLAHSSLIVADRLEHVAKKNVGGGQFVIGETMVRPVVDAQFRQDQRMGIYLQVYNLGIDPATQKPFATIRYFIRREKEEEVVFEHSETTGDLERAAQQVTLEKILPLNTLAPGRYRLDITIEDHIRNTSIQPTTSFSITP